MRLDLEQQVKDRIANSGDDVVNRVVAKMAEETISQRAELVVNALGNLVKLRAMLTKAQRPDAITYNEDGTVATRSFTKAAIDKQQMLAKFVKRYEDAMDKAFAAPPDYSVLKGVVSQKIPADEKPEKEEKVAAEEQPS